MYTELFINVSDFAFLSMIMFLLLRLEMCRFSRSTDGDLTHNNLASSVIAMYLKRLCTVNRLF